jgi:trimeric autotransporter adhesin
MTRIIFRFVETSKLRWHACAVVLVLLLMLAKPSGAQTDNTAYGIGALQGNTTGDYNSAFGFNALFENNGGFNTGTGYLALYSNVNGSYNTATGGKALYNDAGSTTEGTGSYNTATGYGTLYSNTTGYANLADGYKALLNNQTGNDNTAVGYEALYDSNGTFNTAVGAGALLDNASSNYNTGVGAEALLGNTTGSGNIALGAFAGTYLTTGNNNIDIGNSGAAGDDNTIKIGLKGVQAATYIAGIHGTTIAGGVAVVVDAAGQLGVKTSSARFKEAIKPMDDASEAILALKPVTFRYKKELDQEGIPQFGLVAEQVEKVDPDLVVRDEKGQVFTVRYEAVNAMLLNEFLKEHQRVQELQTRMDAMATQMKEQARAIEDVSKKMENKGLATEQLTSYQVVRAE